VIDSAFPIITTPDLTRALGFYRDMLDGTVTYQFPPEGDPAFVSITIGASSVLGINHDPFVDGGPAGSSVGSARIGLWVYTVDCAAAVERLRGAGVTVVQEPAVQPWGETVALVEDPDGNAVMIGQPALSP